MHRENGTMVACQCTGAFIGAAAGLLDGKEASSHWNSIEELKELHPAVNWHPERIITDIGGTFTSGGAISSFNLILYIIEKYVDKLNEYLAEHSELQDLTLDRPI